MTCARSSSSPSASSSSPTGRSSPTTRRQRSPARTATQTSRASSCNSPTKRGEHELAPHSRRHETTGVRPVARPASMVRHRLLAVDGHHPVGQSRHVRGAHELQRLGVDSVSHRRHHAVPCPVPEPDRGRHRFLEETWSRNLLNVLTTPVTELEYLAGTAIFGFFKVAFAMATLIVTAVVFFRFHISEIGWAIVPISMILTLVGWGVGVACIG